MKPTNLNKETCNPISSNCVVWQGPDIACIQLCKGDSVSDVVAKLATELCTVLDTLDIQNYDIACFNISACGPQNFQQLIQLIIDQICELQNIPIPPDTGKSGCPDCLVTVADCFKDELGETAQLLDYVNAIAAKVCTLVLQVGVIQNTLINLDDRVTVLEGYFPLPAPTEVEITPDCVLPAVPTPVSVVLTALELQFCQLIGATGSASEIIAAYLSQCVGNGDPRKDGGGVMSSLPGWISTVTSLADSITNIWLTICDLRNTPEVTLAVTDTQTIDLTVSAGPNYTLSADIVDTGWVDLEGFNYYSGTMAATRPKCRRIGNVIHFKGTVTVPISSTSDYNTLVPLSSSSIYNSQAVPYVFGGVDGLLGNGVLVNTAGSITFNAGLSVVPTSVWSGSFDDTYSGGIVIATRAIDLSATYGTALSAALSLAITSSGALVVATIKDQELTSTKGGSSGGLVGGSQLRYITANVRSGEYVPNFANADTDIHNLPATGVSNLVAETEFTSNTPASLPVDITWPFSCDAAQETQIGGFGFRLDGLMAYVAP